MASDGVTVKLEGVDELKRALADAAKQIRTKAVRGALRQAGKRFERDYLLQVLGRCRWNRTQAARQLGIERKTLYLKMRELGLLQQAD